MIVTTFRKITGNIYQENKHINVMATKSSKRNDSEVSDKLREIKQMQSNWMHQRAKIKEYGEDSSVPRETKARTKSLKKTEDTSNKSKNAKKESDPCVWIVGSGQKKTKTSSLRTRSASPVSRHSSSSGSTGSISRGPSRTNSGKPPTPKTASGNARLKKKSLNNDIEDTHVAQQTHMKQNSDFDVVETVTRTAAEVPDDHRTIHSVKTELSDIKEKLATRDSQGLMAPDMFDKLADQIANRVKAELEHEREQELYTRPTRTVAAVEDDVMASHRCEKCKQLMVPPDHTPTLLIPCGHTLCEACAEDRIKCPTCRTKVTSLTCNTTLLSIIQDFIDQKKPGYYAHGMLSHDSSKPGGQYTPSKYTDPRNHKYNVDSLHRETPTNSHKNGQHYAEDYQSLLIRSEALKNEKDVIKESLKSCTQNISQQKKQIGNIAREEDKLLEQIAALQERLDSLRTHKKDYEQKMKNLIETQEEENSRLMLVEDTLRTIHNNLEKVKLLANNFNVQVGNQ